MEHTISRHINPRIYSFLLLFVFVLVFAPGSAMAVERTGRGDELKSEELPDAPVPQVAVSEPESNGQSSSQADSQAAVVTVTATGTEKIDEEKALEQLKAQRHQRVLGIFPMFSVTYLGDKTLSMTPKQKFGLAIRSSLDPMAFVSPFFVAGIHEVLNDHPEFPGGIKGLGQLAGAAYADSTDAKLIGTGMLPSILHQDPRYYRLGYGSTSRRAWYAITTAVICKHDNTGKWEPNYSNVGGNIAAGAISTLYYPESDGGAELAITNGLIVTALGSAGAIFNEFWPDISRKFLHKDPTNGYDAQRAASEKARKAATRSAP